MLNVEVEPTSREEILGEARVSDRTRVTPRKPQNQGDNRFRETPTLQKKDVDNMD
jgi:hypothetical protein